MPELDLLNLPEAPINDAVEDIRSGLANATDLDGNLLNQSVLLGEDAVLLDAMQLRIRPEDAPCIRIFYSTNRHNMQGQHGGVVEVDVQLNLYFLYYVGVPSMETIPTSFQRMRENHIRWCLENIQFNVFPNNIGIPVPYNKWKYVPQIAVCDHDTPLRYFDQFLQIPVSSTFQCSRLDLTIQVRNHQNAVH